MQEFLNMGGYAAFVWPSYVISAVLLIALVYGSVRRLHRIQREIKPLDEDRKARRRRPARQEGVSS